MRKILLSALAIASVVITQGASAGQVSKGTNFTVDGDPDGECKTGGCTVKLTVTAINKFHVNKDYPYKFKAEDLAGVEFQGKDAGGKNVFSKAAGDFKLGPEVAGIGGAEKGFMSVRFNAKTAGAVKITGKLKLSVCNEANCQMETADIAATVTVK
jgi:hypothetical protein